VEVLTKPFEDALVKYRSLSEGVLFIDFQPGNGYKYQVLICDTPNINSPDENAKVIVRLDHRGSNEHAALTLEHTYSLHWTYIQEKLGGSEMDARAMTKLICELLKLEEE
jgi:hypothetical protein